MVRSVIVRDWNPLWRELLELQQLSNKSILLRVSLLLFICSILLPFALHQENQVSVETATKGEIFFLFYYGEAMFM